MNARRSLKAESRLKGRVRHGRNKGLGETAPAGAMSRGRRRSQIHSIVTDSSDDSGDYSSSDDSEYTFEGSTSSSDSSSSSSSSSSSTDANRSDERYSDMDESSDSEYYYSGYGKNYLDYYTGDGRQTHMEKDNVYNSNFTTIVQEETLKTYTSGWFPDVLLEELGKGAFGTVYLAFCKSKKKHFAVKRAGGSKTCDLAYKTLTREADILKKLKSPYVIKFLGEIRKTRNISADITVKHLQYTSEIYLQYINNGTLADLIKKTLKCKGRLSENRIRRYAKQILKGLRYIHSKNIIHCDIKASNILMGETCVKISDFGVSKKLEKKPKRGPGSLISRAGTRSWMAPEVIARVEQGPPADIWSLGCTVVQMITGRPPETPGVKAFLNSLGPGNKAADREHVSSRFRSLSKSLLTFLGKMFIEDPRKRWTCEELLHHGFLAR